MQVKIGDANIRLPTIARKYILYQRTKIDLDTPIGAASAKLALLVPALYRPLVALRAALQGKRVERRYAAILKGEYESIKDLLPRTDAPTLVDIGCGIAGIDTFLSAHYSHKARFVLVDKTQIDSAIHYGFEKEASFYGNLPLAKQVMIENGTPADAVDLMTPEEFISKSPRADLVVSLESWGFHYPLDTYIKTVKACLAPGGMLIVEVRKNSGGLEELREHFADVRVIQDAKRQRVVCTLPH